MLTYARCFCLHSLLLVCMLMPEAAAVMQGELLEDAPVAQLVFEHRDWHEYRQQWRVSHSECSAVIVGVKPLTLLTAAHCLRDVAKDAESGLPHVKIAQAIQPGLLAAKLQHVISPEFDKVRGNLIDDLAVLVFDLHYSDEHVVAPVLLDAPSGDITICGYGYGAADAQAQPQSQPQPQPQLQPQLQPQALRCGAQHLHGGAEDFKHFVPLDYKSEDPLFYARYRTQFESKGSAVSSLDALWAINRLNAQGQYDVHLPMPTLGDSGGPWLQGLSNGRYAVIGVTSFVESFYNSSPQWAFFRQSPAPLQDFVYAAYGIRLDSMRARKLFNAARIKGADIRVLRESWLD